MSKVISDTGHKTVHAIAAENPPEGDLCFLLEDLDFMVVLGGGGCLVWFVFLVLLPFFVSLFCRFKKFWYC